MAELFFSYSAKDRDRVRPICEALTERGFEVFWDQNLPPGSDWDRRIKEQLASARCAIVFWSLVSIGSDNVRHEATVAKDMGKLVPVMLDPLSVGQFPMGLFNTQAARLTDWAGNDDDPEWQKLIVEIEGKSMPAWAGRRIASLEAAFRAESRRRETAVAKEDAAEKELAQEIDKHGPLRRERDRAQAEAETARAELAGLKEVLSATKTQNDDLSTRLASAEQAGASVRARFPLRLLLIGIIGALAVGAGATYFIQEGSWKAREGETARLLQKRIDELQAEAQARGTALADFERRANHEREQRAANEELERRQAEQRRITDEGRLPVQLGLGAGGQRVEADDGKPPLQLGVGAQRETDEAPVQLGLGGRR